MRFILPMATLVLALSACVPPPASPPPPAPPPVPVPAPAPAPALSADWRDWPIAAGNWSYRTEPGGSVAAFGLPGAEPATWLRCVAQTRQVQVARAGMGTAAEIAITTSFGAVRWPGVAQPTPARTVVTRAAVDIALDQIASSRGRFAIQVPGLPPLALPAWPEIARVVEDCRG